MNELETVLSSLKGHRDALRARGVLHAAVFGSTARGTSNNASDVDIVIDLDEAKPINVFDYTSIKDEIKAIVGEGSKVDVVIREGLKGAIRRRVESEAIDAF